MGNLHDVSCEDTAGNSDPAKTIPQLERQHHDVDPGDLRNGDRIGNRQRGLQDTVHTDKGFVELDDAGNGLVLVQTNIQGVVFDEAVNIGGDVVEDFERQVTERLLGALDPLAGVGLGKGDAEVFTNGLQLLLISGSGDVDFGSTSKGVEELNTVAEIRVVDTRLKSKPVLDGAGICVEQIKGRQLVKQVFLTKLALAFLGVNPDCPCQVLADEDELTPVLATFGVALIGRACPERNGQTNDETKDGEKQIADNEGIDELRNAGDCSSPDSNNDDWQDHLGKDGTMHSHKIWPFAVFGHVTRSDLSTSVRRIVYTINGTHYSQSSPRHQGCQWSDALKELGR